LKKKRKFRKETITPKQKKKKEEMSLIIPVKCFTCGNLISNKYSKYLSLITDPKADTEFIKYIEGSIERGAVAGGGGAVAGGGAGGEGRRRVEELIRQEQDKSHDYLTKDSTKSISGHAMDYLNFRKLCCRRHILTQVEYD